MMSGELARYEEHATERLVEHVLFDWTSGMSREFVYDIPVEPLTVPSGGEAFSDRGYRDLALAHLEVAKRFLEEGRRLIAKDVVRARGKLYRAAEEAVKALAYAYGLEDVLEEAERRRWTAALLEEVVKRLSGEVEGLREAWDAACFLRACGLGEVETDRRSVEVRIAPIERLIEALKMLPLLSPWVPPELEREWPEVAAICRKLARDEGLSERDMLWVRELAEASGWSVEDTIDELRNIEVNPSERAERYREMFKEYYGKALEYKRRGDTRQAGEKLWGAAVALIKLYAALKNVPVVYWSRGKLENFVTNNVERKHRKLFRDLLDKAHVLHEHFYEGELDEKTFEERWEEAVEYLERVKSAVFRETTQRSYK